MKAALWWAGRVPYNDIQCGNGPANDAPDEAGCPGRVDIGRSGCKQIGPKWDLASVYGGNPPDDEALSRSNDQDYPRSYRVLVSDDGIAWRGPVATGDGVGSVTEIGFSRQTARHVRIEQDGSDNARWWSIADLQLRVSGGASGPALNTQGWTLFASSDPSHTGSAVDGVAGSRWATRTAQSPGQFFLIDMLKTQRFNKIVLASEGNPFDCPRRYRVMASNDGVQWGAAIASGAGSSATTTISFSARSARYIPIEQTGSHPSHWWSIHELSVLAAE
jgi:F5/8 type C domain